VECAIEEYEGTLIFVSHDRYFVDKFATRIWELEDGTIKDYPCGYAKYRSLKENAAVRPIPQTEKPAKKEKPAQKVDSKALEKEVRRLEREIDKQEQAVAALDEQLLAAAADYKELMRLTEEKEAAEAELAELMEKWEAAAGQLE
ncbi:MAG: ABC transporter ATP-binding protein, partial [Oscillospiraceae bacterium]|nr:ABC transporter ATP-binding protein [Oscillospiraceae bacterium]